MVDNQLYTSSSNGNLVRRTWNPSTGLPVSGTNETVSGPNIDGEDWRARDTFNYAPAGFEVPNTPPTASFSESCSGATCSFDAAASSDPDGSIASYAWDFGDSTSPGTGVTANHVYAVSGTYTVSLTVTEFMLLQALAQRPGFVKSRDQLMDVAYDDQVYVDDRTIESHIKRLRKKMRSVDEEFLAIETLYGIGYRYNEE